MPYNSNDNIRVNRPLIQEPIKYKLQPGEVRLPSGQIIKVRQEELSQGSSEPKVLRDKRYKELTKQHEWQKQKEREASTIQGLTALLQLISPSHIIGSANSDKPFLEAYLGDSYNSATGNMLGDFALDAVVGGGLWKGAKVAGDLSRAAVTTARPYIIANRLNRNINKTTLGLPKDYTFYHGGLSENFDFSNLDVLRPAMRQQKRGRNYAGFYMYDQANKTNAFKYGDGYAHGINLKSDAKVAEYPDITDRLSQETLQEYIDKGYDVLKGKDVRGRTEYILLNKNAIQETGYLTTPPKEIQITSINKPSEDGAMVFYQRPSKLSDAEKAGVPKGERNLQSHGQAQEPYYDYSLINRNNGIWKVDEKGRFVFPSPEVSKKLGTIHFSLNNPVETHIGGSWQGMPTTILLPYRNVRSQVRPASLAIMDTFFPNYGGLKFSSRGAKVFTGDRKAFEYYKNKGIDVEFSNEIEGYLKRLDEINNKIHTNYNVNSYAYRDDFPEELENLVAEKGKLEDLIGNFHKNFSDKYAKKLPNYEAVKAWGESEGLSQDFIRGLAQKNQEISYIGVKNVEIWITNGVQIQVIILVPQKVYKASNPQTNYPRAGFLDFLKRKIGTVG